MPRAHPYDLYDTVDWEVPVLYGGDVFDRFRIRMLEIRQSLQIIRQLLDRGMPDGPYIVDDPHVALPPKEACYNQMEAMIYHFKLIMDGIQVAGGRDLPHGRGGQRRARLLRHQRRHRASRTASRCGRPASPSSRPSRA